MINKTGIELIVEERKEQISKHGFSKNSDKSYIEGELLQAACFCLKKAEAQFYYNDLIVCSHTWPKGWNIEFKNKILAKSQIKKLIVAGAFFMAENDRLGENLYQPYIDKVAASINQLLTNGQQDKD